MPRSPLLKTLAVACALALAAPVPPRAQVNLPSLGDTVSEQVGVGTERRLGDQIMREIRRDPDYLDDPLLLEYVQSLWSPLVAAARARGDIGADLDARFAWEAFLVRDRSVNAFALPGGFVGVHLGLVSLTSTRDQLASVLAHELSHVTQRHIARSIVNEQRQSLIGLATMILGIIAASRSTRPDAANAIITGGQAAAVQGMLNFSRDMEREADRIGFALLERAGFATAGMAQMFEKLDGASRLNDSLGYPYLRTHPLTVERIGEARLRAGTGAPAPLPPAPLEHELMRARARVLMDARVDALRRLQAQDAQAGGAAAPLERAGLLAASALASARLRDGARAVATAERAQAALREAAAGEPRAERGADLARAERALALLMAEAQLEAGQAARAAATLRPYETDGSRATALARAQVALAAGAADALRRSAEELQTRVTQTPADATAWLTLSQVWTRLEQPLRAVRAEAESRAAIGDLNGAVDRLRAGQRLARTAGRPDFIEASVIDARLRELDAQRRELAAEMRGDGKGNPLQ